ncbi:uncharacterized protein LOC130823355 [Amaranthus tricolor]|uniref:uncharacterized protein LOC130823355 n=1 Tax=Amaranthus tricolor TaxID=29722 RepID=UPI002586A937|nr:uncharacterized protein LOC130823355 [Amaranthus tricolor]
MAETPEKALLDYITPDASIVTTSIVRPEIFGNQYEIRSAFFNWIAQDQFHESAHITDYRINALRHEIQTSLDAAAGGNFMMKTLTQAKKILDDMASNYHWREQSTPRRGGRYEVDAIVALTNNVRALTRKVEQLDVATVNKVCGACGLNGHSSVDCQLQAEGVAAVEQVNAIQNQNARQQYNPYSNTFNPEWRDHPNFSYRNNNAQNPSSSYNIPSGFQQRPPFPPQQQHPPKSNLESLMENFIATQSKQNEHFSTSINQILAHNKMIDTQMAQMAQQLSNLSVQKGQFPGNTEKNPTTSPHQQLNAVTTRSGRTLHDPAPKVKTSPTVVPAPGTNDDVSEEKKDEPVNSDKSIIAGRTYTPPVSFPSRLAQAKLEHKYRKFLQVLSKLQINIPFLEAIKEMPSYAKFLKDITSNKRKLEESVVETLNGQCSAILQCKVPKKQADPGSFTIPLKLGNDVSVVALADLGASVSVMPLTLCKKINGEMKATRMSIQLAD